MWYGPYLVRTKEFEAMTKLAKKESPEDVSQWIDDFWQWSCHIYQNQEVAKLCLAVQDTLGLNVNYMLLALWAEQQNLGIDSSTWLQISEDAKAAQDAVLYIREKRLTLKGKSEEAYKQALLIELKAEQEHQKQAIQALSQQYGKKGFIESSNQNLQQYLESNQISSQDQETVQQLGQLVQNVSL